MDEDEDGSLEVVPDMALEGVVEGNASDLDWVFMRTCSTMSSSVLARLDQHSRAAAMAALQQRIRQQ